MLIAAEYNWDDMAPGDWAGTTWTIYSDGTYTIEYKIYEPKAYTLKKTKNRESNLEKCRCCVYQDLRDY